MKIIINRYESTGKGTLSKVSVIDSDNPTPNAQVARFFGIECPWRDNKVSVSCIPGGEYDLVPHSSDKYGEVWAFVGGTVSHYYEKNKSERYACLIHVANYASQLQGCLALGVDAGSNDGVPAVWNSRKAIESLRRHFGDRTNLTASIRWFQDE